MQQARDLNGLITNLRLAGNEDIVTWTHRRMRYNTNESYQLLIRGPSQGDSNWIISITLWAVWITRNNLM